MSGACVVYGQCTGGMGNAWGVHETWQLEAWGMHGGCMVVMWAKVSRHTECYGAIGEEGRDRRSDQQSNTVNTSPRPFAPQPLPAPACPRTLPCVAVAVAVLAPPHVLAWPPELEPEPGL